MDNGDGGNGSALDEKISFYQQKFCNLNQKYALSNFPSCDLYNQNCNYCVTGSPRKKRRTQLRNATHKEPSNNEDLISHLPDECILEIFSYLPSSRDRCSCSAVNKKWLALQANMRSSEFKSNSKKELWASGGQRENMARFLQGKKANDSRLAAIAVGLCASGGLSELRIMGGSPSQGITDAGLAIIAHACPAMRSISLWNCTKVRSKGINSIAEGCTSLEKLELVNLPFVDDRGLVSIARNSKNLSTLNIESCPLIGNAALEAFSISSSKLASLSLKRCPLVGDKSILSIISSSYKLSKLKLVSLGISSVKVLAAIGRRGRSLDSLSLVNISCITQPVIGLISLKYAFRLKSCCGLYESSFKVNGEGFTGLKHIFFKKCDNLTDEGLKELMKSTSLLEILVLEDCNAVTRVGLIEAVTNCSETLKTLALVRCQGIADNSSSCSPIYLQKYPSLCSLKLKNSDGIGDSFMEWIAPACSQLKHLSLVGLRSVTDRGIVTLTKTLKTKHRSLVSLDLGGCCCLTDLSVFAITFSVGGKLQKLILDGCERLTDRSLKLIAEQCPCLRDLDLSRCSISDDGVLSLATSQRQSLEVLCLAGCSDITDRSLLYLEMMCGSLVGLNLKRCPRVSKGGLDSVRKTLWWCDLVC